LQRGPVVTEAFEPRTCRSNRGSETPRKGPKRATPPAAPRSTTAIGADQTDGKPPDPIGQGWGRSAPFRDGHGDRGPGEMKKATGHQPDGLDNGAGQPSCQPPPLSVFVRRHGAAACQPPAGQRPPRSRRAGRWWPVRPAGCRSDKCSAGRAERSGSAPETLG
jgi:hypothetical protein